jgi:hypothetical protein
MAEDDLELLITVVVGADDELQARSACAALLRQVSGRVVQVGDCSDEEPGCWSVTISALSGEHVTHNVAGALARAVRTFVRVLGDDFPTPRVACEPPTAWTVLDDPELLDALVPGAERLLVEAWAGGDPDRKWAEEAQADTEVESESPEWPPEDVAQEPEDSPVRVENSTVSGVRLLLRVDVKADRRAGAEWQARAVASRVAHTSYITRVDPHDHLLSVHVDLGPSADSPTTALLGAVSSMGRSGWSAVEWVGDDAVIRWSATPAPDSGITALELTASATSTSVWTEPE